MSESPSTLPPRPSLEQLRKQAKDRLDSMPGARLADSQFALARDYGFDNWPKLVHHVEALARPDVDQQERIAHDMVEAYRHHDEGAAARLNDLFHSAITIDQIRDFIRTRLSPLPDGAERLGRFDLGDARLLVARLYGFEDWDGYLTASAGPARRAAPGLSSTAPFCRIDEARGLISPQQPMSPRDWDALIGIMKERGLTGLEANNMMDDAAMATLTAVPHVRALKLHGSNRLTDNGLRHLAAFGELEEIALGGWHSPMTDAGFSALRALPRLRSVHAYWSRHITDAGIRETLSPCPMLEDVNFMGAPVGDGPIEALAGKPNVSRLFAGSAVTDAMLARLQAYPRFSRWSGGEPRYSLMEFQAGPTHLGLQGSFSAPALRALQSLHGLFALKLEWKPGTLASGILGQLAPMEQLGFLGIDGDTCDDEAMRQIATLPRLKMLLAQGPVAGDAGFQGLSRSATLEYYWGRECPNLSGRGFAAMAAMPALKGLAVSCKHVDDQALATLPGFPSLQSLVPMDVTDDGFRHIGRCNRLEELWCMYCQDTGDAAVDHIAPLRLKTYYAGATKISDRGLSVLATMSTLERIHLHYCQGVTDAGVRRLARLPHLRELTIEGSRNVTRAGVTGFPPPVLIRYSTI
jgi:hypothetical protein